MKLTVSGMFLPFFSPVRVAVKNCLSEVALRYSGGPSKSSGVSFLSLNSSGYHTSSVLHLGRKDRKASGTDYVQKKPVHEGENSTFVESVRSREESRFPDLHTPLKEFNGILFKDLPILYVKATMNNTLMSVSDSAGLTLLHRSCGMDGFKNARKGTNVAAQATGFVLGKKMMQRGYRTVRAKVGGLGPGRLSSLRGVAFAGVNIISITDSTPISWNPPRPKKQRRI